MEQPKKVLIKGQWWYLYTIEYDTPEGLFSLNFYATSFEHAELLLIDLKETARVVGKIV